MNYTTPTADPCLTINVSFIKFYFKFFSIIFHLFWLQEISTKPETVDFFFLQKGGPKDSNIQINFATKCVCVKKNKKKLKQNHKSYKLLYYTISFYWDKIIEQDHKLSRYASFLSEVTLMQTQINGFTSFVPQYIQHKVTGM